MQKSGRAVLLRLLRVKLWVVGRCVVEVVRRRKGKERRINAAESLLQALDSLTPLFIPGLLLMN